MTHVPHPPPDFILKTKREKNKDNFKFCAKKVVVKGVAAFRSSMIDENISNFKCSVFFDDCMVPDMHDR